MVRRYNRVDFGRCCFGDSKTTGSTAPYEKLQGLLGLIRLEDVGRKMQMGKLVLLALYREISLKVVYLQNEFTLAHAFTPCSAFWSAASQQRE